MILPLLLHFPPVYFTKAFMGHFKIKQIKIISNLPGACNKIGGMLDSAMGTAFGRALCSVHQEENNRHFRDCISIWKGLVSARLLFTFLDLVWRDFVTNYKQNVDMCMCLNSNRAAAASRSYIYERVNEWHVRKMCVEAHKFPAQNWIFHLFASNQKC